MAKIEDGTGSGKSAKVDNENRLKTFSISRHEHEENALHEAQFFLWSFSTVCAGAADFFYLQNDNDLKLLVISEIELTASTDGPVVTVKTGSTYTSGGTVITPFNMNLTSGKSATATAYQAAALTLSGGTSRWDTYVKQYYSTEVMDEPMMMVLGKSNTFHLSVNSATTLKGHVAGFFVNVEDIL